LPEMKGAFLAAIPIIVLSITLSEVSGNEVTITLGHTGSQPLNLFDLFRFPVKQLTSAIRKDLIPTMWCGFDNDAPDDRAVSPIYPNVDRCCRDHDHCPTFIPRGECLDGICNHSYLVPIMDCQCEEEFQKCLREVPKSRARNRELLPDEGAQSVPKDEKEQGRTRVDWRRPAHARGSAIAEAILTSVVWTSYFEVIPLISHLHEDDEEHKKTHHTQCIRRIEDLDQTDDSKDEKQSRWRLEEIPSFINHKRHQHLDEAVADHHHHLHHHTEDADQKDGSHHQHSESEIIFPKSYHSFKSQYKKIK